MTGPINVNAHEVEKITRRDYERGGTVWVEITIHAQGHSLTICCYAADRDPANLEIVKEGP